MKIRLQCWSFHDHSCQVTFQSPGPARGDARYDAPDPDRSSPLLSSGRRRWPLFCHQADRTGDPDCTRHTLRREAYCGFDEVILISDRGKKDQVAAANSWIDFGVFARRASGDRACGQRASHSFIKLNTLRRPLPWQQRKTKAPARKGRARFSMGCAGQWNVKSDALRPKLARPSTLCTLLRWANSSTWFAEVT